MSLTSSSSRRVGSLRRCQVGNISISGDRVPLPTLQARRISGTQTGQLAPKLLTDLHKARALFPRLLPPDTGPTKAPAIKSLELWKRVLTASPVQSEITLAVIDTDAWSASRHLVTMLLREPFASDASDDERVASRWSNHDSTPSMRIRVELSADPSTFQCSSSYLRQLPVPLQIQEFASSQRNSSTFLQDALTLEGYLHADVPLIVINPLTTSPDAILHIRGILQNPNTIFLITHVSSSPEDLAALHARYGHCAEDAKVLFVDPYLALKALDTLAANPSSSTAVQQYQNDFVLSGASLVMRTIQQIVQSTGKTSPQEILLALQEQRSAAQLRAALNVARTQLNLEQAESDAQSLAISRITERVEEERIRSYTQIFDSETSAQIDVVAQKCVQAELAKLSWWKMVGHVDDITTVISAIVANSMSDLEKQLVYNTGRLSFVQKYYASQMMKALPSPDSHLHSSLLQNELQQLIASPTYSIGPGAFLKPLAKRQAQIINHPTASLHVAGQRSVLGMAGSAVTGLTLGWAGWMEWLTGGVSAFGVDASTLMGAGGLISILGLRWAIGHWEKAKKRWWADWRRIYDGLGRDLKKSSDEVLRNQVLVVADRGCAALHNAIEERNREIGEIAEEIAALEASDSLPPATDRDMTR